MRVRQMSEPEFSFLVTGCDDVAKAREAVVAEFEDEIAEEYYDTENPVDVWFEKHPGRLETGRIFNCRDHDPFGNDLAWYWMRSEPGRGATKAVLFDSYEIWKARVAADAV